MAGGFRYVLQSDAGENLGEFVTSVPDWRVGEAFQTGDGRRFRILEIVPFLEDDDVYRGMWKVKELGVEDHEQSNGRPETAEPG